MNPDDMTEDYARKLYAGAIATADEIIDQLTKAGADGAYGHVILCVALAKWLVNHYQKGGLQDDDLHGTIETTTMAIRDWAAEEIRKSMGGG